MVKDLGLSAASTYIRSCINGWTTSHRFKVQVLKCVFGGQAGADEFVHYAQCTAIRSIALRRFKGIASLGYRHQGMLEFIDASGGLSGPALLALGILHDAIFAVVAAARRGGGQGSAEDRLIARVRALATKSGKVRAALPALLRADAAPTPPRKARPAHQQ